MAASIIAYATHIDNLGALTEAIELIVTKHCGLQVLPEHYSIVHDNLMIAVGTVLGAAVTPEIATAWSTAVNFLAKVLWEAEEAKYVLAESKSGGWRGWKEFTISNIETVSTGVKTFTMVPKGKLTILTILTILTNMLIYIYLPIYIYLLIYLYLSLSIYRWCHC